MSDKRRVQNANPKTCDGIEFKSTLEAITYKTLVENGIVPEYEKHPYVIWEGFSPTIPYYTKNTLTRKNKWCVPLSRTLMVVNRPIKETAYVPDFYFEYGKKKVLVEVKGFRTQLFDLKFKMFRKLLESFPDKENYIIWEIYSKKQLLECISHLPQSPSQ